MRPNNQVLGTPLKIIFIKTFDPWGNAYALLQSEKQDTISWTLRFSAIQLRKAVSMGQQMSQTCTVAVCVLFCISQISYQDHV